MHLRSLVSIFGLTLIACGGQEAISQTTDPGAKPIDVTGSSPPMTTTTPAAGTKIRDISNPSAPTHAADNAKITVSGATVLVTDTFDETKDGKSVGNVYVQDANSNAPYSGMTLNDPSFVPSGVQIVPGDVLDVTGEYQEISSIGTVVFPAGESLREIFRPTATLRIKATTPAPRVIDATDLDDYSKGRQWIGMLVTINDVTLASDPVDASCASGKATGRVAAYLTTGAKGQLVNDLYDIKPSPFDCEGAAAYPSGTHFKSITGIVSYFFTMHLAPRSAVDLVR